MKNNIEPIIKNLKAFAFDVDGVLFPNETWWFSDGSFMKRRSLYDGQGISLLRAMGIQVAFITSAKGEMAKPVEDLVSKWNALPSSKSGSDPNGWEHVRLFSSQNSLKKIETLKSWLTEINVPLTQCAAMGDDLVDLPMLRAAGFSVAPFQAEKNIKELCHYVTERSGGEGAIRDAVNYILNVRGVDPTTLPLQ